MSTPDDWRLRGIVGASRKTTSCTTRPPGSTRAFRPAPPTAGGNRVIPAVSRISARSPGRPCRIPACRPTTPRSIRTGARDQADRLLRLGGLRSDTEGADGSPWARATSASTIPRTAASSRASPASRGRCRRRLLALSGDTAYNLNAQNLRDTESGFKSRANLTWHVTPDIMVYYTFSQGFRPGGFNQNGGASTLRARTAVPQYSCRVVLLGQADQQRNRLEDRILRSPPAMERRRLPRELE